jgi:hypothetical protein
MSRPPAKQLPKALLALAAVGAVLFAATGSFVVAPWLFPRKPGEFAIAPVLVTTLMGMVGAMVGVGLGSRLLARK